MCSKETRCSSSLRFKSQYLCDCPSLSHANCPTRLLFQQLYFYRSLTASILFSRLKMLTASYIIWKIKNSVKILEKIWPKIIISWDCVRQKVLTQLYLKSLVSITLNMYHNYVYIYITLFYAHTYRPFQVFLYIATNPSHISITVHSS